MMNMTGRAVLSDLHAVNTGNLQHCIETSTVPQSITSSSTSSPTTQKTTQSPDTPMTEPTDTSEEQDQKNILSKYRSTPIIQGFSPLEVTIQRIASQDSSKSVAQEDPVSEAGSPTTFGLLRRRNKITLDGPSHDNALSSQEIHDVSESAVCDDDSDFDSDWEDCIDEDNGKLSVDCPLGIERMPLNPNSSSQRSLISLMFAGQEQQQQHRSNKIYVSQLTSTTPCHRLHTSDNSQLITTGQDSDKNGLEIKGSEEYTAISPRDKASRSSAQTIVSTTQSNHQTVMSPRTTRRNMLETELTEMLRNHLLRERRKIAYTSNAVLERRGEHSPTADEEVDDCTSGQCLKGVDIGGYHTQGW